MQQVRNNHSPRHIRLQVCWLETALRERPRLSSRYNQFWYPEIRARKLSLYIAGSNSLKGYEQRLDFCLTDKTFCFDRCFHFVRNGANCERTRHFAERIHRSG